MALPRRARLLGGPHGLQTLHIQRGVVGALVVDQAGVAQAQRGVHGGWKQSRHARWQRGCIGCVLLGCVRGREHGIDITRLAALLLHRVQPQGKAAQAGLLAGVARGVAVQNGGLKIGALHGQHTAGGDAAEHGGAHHGTGLAGQCRHVQHMAGAAVLLQQVHQRGVVQTAIAELHFFLCGQRAVAGADHTGAVGRTQPECGLPGGFQQLRRHQQVQAAGQGVEAKHWALPTQGAVGCGKHLQVIRGGAGALGHTRH